MRSREMLRRLNRVAPVKEPDPLAEVSARLDFATEDELLEVRAIIHRVMQEGWERPKDWDQELRNRLWALEAAMIARQAKGTRPDSEIGGRKTRVKGARSPGPR